MSIGGEARGRFSPDAEGRWEYATAPGNHGAVRVVADYRDAPTLGVPDQYFLQHLGEHRFPERTFTLPAGSYDVDVLDVWEQTVRSERRSVEGETGPLTVRLPGTRYQAVRILRVA